MIYSPCFARPPKEFSPSTTALVATPANMVTTIDDNEIATREAVEPSGTDEKHDVPARSLELPAYEHAGGPSRLPQYEGEEFPSDEDVKTLRRIPDKIPFLVYTYVVPVISYCAR